MARVTSGGSVTMRTATRVDAEQTSKPLVGGNCDFPIYWSAQSSVAVDTTPAGSLCIRNARRHRVLASYSCAPFTTALATCCNVWVTIVESAHVPAPNTLPNRPRTDEVALWSVVRATRSETAILYANRSSFPYGYQSLAVDNLRASACTTNRNSRGVAEDDQLQTLDYLPAPILDELFCLPRRVRQRDRTLSTRSLRR